MIYLPHTDVVITSYSCTFMETRFYDTFDSKGNFIPYNPSMGAEMTTPQLSLIGKAKDFINDLPKHHIESHDLRGNRRTQGETSDYTKNVVRVLRSRGETFLALPSNTRNDTPFPITTHGEIHQIEISPPPLLLQFSDSFDTGYTMKMTVDAQSVGYNEPIIFDTNSLAMHAGITLLNNQLDRMHKRVRFTDANDPTTLQSYIARPREHYEQEITSVEHFNSLGLNPLLIHEPKSVKEAMSSPLSKLWLEAMTKEHEAQIKNGTWVYEPIPKGRHPIGSKWVFKVKIENGKLDKLKARLVAQGFSQKYGVDYTETFSPVVSFTAFRLLIAVSVLLKKRVYHADVSNAYLKAYMESDVLVYMKQPEGFHKTSADNIPIFCRLVKCLYGTKQAGRGWHQTIRAYLLREGYYQCKSEVCIFIKETSTYKIILALYVDDIFAIPISLTDLPDTDVWAQFMTSIVERFETVENRGELTFALGCEVTQTENKTSITLKTYSEKCVHNYNLQNCTAPPSPAATHDLTGIPAALAGTKEYDELQNLPIRNMNGSLMYAGLVCRPDLCFAICVLSRRVATPARAHWTALQRAMQYMVTTQNKGLTFTDETDFPHGELIAACDSDWASDLMDRKSTAGGIIWYMGSPIDYFSRKEAVVAISSCEAEYIALCLLVRNIIHLRMLLAEMGQTQMRPTVILMDSQSAIDLSADAKYRKRSKHIDIQYHFTRAAYELGLIEPRYLRGTENPSDGLTKNLQTQTFCKHQQQMVWDID